MDPARFVGSAAVRGATLVLAAVCGISVLRGSPGTGPWLAIGSGLLALIGLIHSFRVTYGAWLRFAEMTQTVIISVLFGACYLLIVPAFRAVTQFSDPLHLRRRSGAQTFWVLRQEDSDPASLERMG